MDAKTKRDWKKFFIESFIEIVTPQLEKMNRRIDSLDEKVVARNDDVFQKMDDIYKEVIAMRQEQTVHAQRHQDIESIPVIAHALKKRR